MRLLVVDESDERAALLGEALTAAGHQVVALLSSPLELLRAVDALRPDVIVIDTESPTRDVLEHVVIVSQSSPRPIVMFASDSGGEAIRNAVRAGETQSAAVVASEFSSRWFRPSFYEDTALIDAKGRLAMEADFLRWTLSDGAGAVIVEPAPQYEIAADGAIQPVATGPCVGH